MIANDRISQLNMTSGSSKRQVQVDLTPDAGTWTCLASTGGCGKTGINVDHVMALGEASRHNYACGGGRLYWIDTPRRAQQITAAGTVEVTADAWTCRTCAASGDGEQVLAHGVLHAQLCGVTDSEAVAAMLVADNPVLHRAMSEWVDERVQDGLADLREQLRGSEELRQLAEQATEEASAANADVAAILAADSDKLRAEVTKPDLKASVLVAASVGAVVAGGGALGGADLPAAAIGAGAGAVAAAVGAVVTLLVAMRPGISDDPDALVTTNIRDTEGQVEAARKRVQAPDLDAMGRERGVLQALVLRKARLTRHAIHAALGSIGLAVVTAAIGAVTALVGGA